MCVLKNRVLLCPCHVHLRIPFANMFFVSFSGGVPFHGTVFTSRFSGDLAQGKHRLSCVIVSNRLTVRYYSLFCRGRTYFSFDAQCFERYCVDRRPAVRNCLAFSAFRFCGFYFRAAALCSGLLWKSISFFLFFSWDHDSLRLRRMAYSVAFDV